MDKKANAAFYGSAALTPQQIFDSEGNMAPAVANNFVQVLSAQTQRLPKQPGIDAAATGTTGATSDRASQPSVRTFGIGDPDTESTDDEHLQEFQD
jgi:hypothetical protein